MLAWHNGCALGFNPRQGLPPFYAGSIPVARSMTRDTMAKHIYHIPLQKSLHFIKENRPKLKNLTTDNKLLEYHKLLGKSYYYLQIEEFMAFFKINKELTYALNTLEYFNSTPFINEIAKNLNFSQFGLEESHINPKDFFYAFCHLYLHHEGEAFGLFIQKIFLHYHTAFNKNSNINIDHKELSHALTKSKHKTLKESFGEDDKGAFFNILLDGKIVISERGKLIKTLRKKGYKRLFYLLIDMDDRDDTTQNEAYETLDALKSL